MARLLWTRANVTFWALDAGRDFLSSGPGRKEEREPGLTIRTLCTPTVSMVSPENGQKQSLLTDLGHPRHTKPFPRGRCMHFSSVFGMLLHKIPIHLSAPRLWEYRNRTSPPICRALPSFCFFSRVNSSFPWTDLCHGGRWRAFWNEWHKPWVSSTNQTTHRLPGSDASL